MASPIVLDQHGDPTREQRNDRIGGSHRIFLAVACLGFIGVSALLSGWLPVGFAIAAVFLFAGPHNWMEARYFFQKMPGRWGKLRAYFVVAIAGVVLLSAGSLLLPSFARSWNWGSESWLTGIAIWNTALVGWILWMAMMRQSETDRLRWNWLIPAAFLLIALTWLYPMMWNLTLVYLHPFVAFWFLDRELGRRDKKLRSTYRWCLATVPVVMVVLWWQLAPTDDLPGLDMLSMQISAHAGSGILEGVSSHLLVSTHTFLEMLHYGVWLFAIPLLTLRSAPWQLRRIPLAEKSKAWAWGIGLFLLAGVAVVVMIWAGFIANYPLTRDLYFTVAIMHVLAEVPFLLRML
ncbi:MAG: hypothetical protein AAF456_03690 [Planctomycetota bacterium]